MNPSCLACKHLGRCSIVTPDMLRTGGWCYDFVAHPQSEVVAARYAVMQKYGEAAIRSLLKPQEEEED